MAKVTCLDGYFHSSIGVCSACKDIKAADGLTPVFSSAATDGFKTCSGATSGPGTIL